jgi:hypothetical protein
MQLVRHDRLTAGPLEALRLSDRRKIPPPLRFFIAFVAFCLLMLFPVLTLNYLVDPLWYFSGNRLSPYSEPFNTRVSKLILIQDDAKKYDCVIFGPSVTTLLDPTKIRDANCFNAAFADGRVEEFPIYARYLKGLGLEPKKIIVDLTPRNFATTRPRLSKLPDFVANGTPPSPAIRAYASFDTFWFSLRSFLGVSQSAQVYDHRFVSHLKPDVPAWSHARRIEEFRSYADFSTESLSFYKELLAVWPSAEKIGIVSFVSASAVTTWREAGVLENYLNTSYAASKLFDSYYDFTAPSEITANDELTFDGLHFVEQPNRLMAERINGAENGSGIAVTGRTYESFHEAYLSSAREWAPKLTATNDKTQ